MPDAPPTAPAVPPKRRWWKRWRVWLLATPVWLPVLLILVWLIWLAIATSQRNAAIAELREAGLPVTFAELVEDVEPLEDAVNAAVDYAAGMSLVDEQGAAFMALREWKVSQLEMTTEERAQWLRLQAQVVAEQSAALERVSAVDAKIRPNVNAVLADFGRWSAMQAQLAAGAPPPDPIDVMLPSMNPVRSLAWVLAADARDAIAHNDGGRTRRGILRLIGFADAINADGHSLVESLVAIGVRAWACEIAIEGADLLAATTSKAEMAESIALLLGESPPSNGYRRAIEGETTVQMQMLAMLAGDGSAVRYVNGEADDLLANPSTGGSAIVGWALLPILRGDQAQIAQFLQQWKASAGAPAWQTAQAQLPKYDDVVQSRLFDLYAGILLPSLDRAAEAHYHVITEVRVAASVLAIAQYRAEHDGAWPESLDELVPEYLPTVPRDAMADGNVPIRYDPARQILWSVGADGIDGNGDASPVSPKLPAETRWEMKDTVIRLGAPAWQTTH